MPYIPWAKYGICKFWMLKRCYDGRDCQWKHPAPSERKRLWDEETAKQDADAARGIPRPVNPRLATRDDTPPTRGDDVKEFQGRYDGASGSSPDRYGSMRPPPPRDPKAIQPRMQPPPGEGNAAPEVDAAQLPISFAGRGSAIPDLSRVSLYSAPEVSMLDAPESPKAKKRPSRFDVLPGVKDLDGRIENFGEHSLEPSANGLDHVGESHAITLWKRDEAVTELCSSEKDNDKDVAVLESDHYTDSQPEQNEYWTRYRNRREAISMTEGEKAAAKVSKASGKRAKPPASFPSITPSVILQRKAGKAAATNKMGATKRMSNGEVKHVGPHPSVIRVSARYASQASIEKKLQPQPAADTQAQPDVQERLTAEAREDSIRLQGCRWIDDVRRQMQLPIRTFTTACTYYHKFRLAHPQHVAGMEYGNAWADACAASLLTACKVEDTLKKSKDILAAAHNLRAATSGGEQVGTDDAMFEAPSRLVIGLERLVLEAGSFDFRSKYPHELMVKIGKTLDGDEAEKRAITGLAWTVLTDLHRTFAPLKQTSASMAVASLELASHLYAAGTPNDSSAVRDSFAEFNYGKHSTSREDVMETILDALDLYTHHTLQTLLGSKYSLDDHLRIRLAFNKECSENNLPRFTLPSPRETEQEPNGNTLRVQNGHPTPVSPPQPETQNQAQAQQSSAQPTPEGGGTLRFMLNPQLAADEKSEVQKYFVEEWEEYEEEIEVPVPRAPSPDHGSERGERRPPLPGPPRRVPPGPPRADYRGGPGRYDDRRPGGGYEDRRYEDRRYDERRGGRYEDRRYDDRRRERR